MSFRSYERYRDSGVVWLGAVPAHWSCGALKRGFDVRLGKMLQPEQRHSSDQLQPYLRAANIQPSGVDVSDVRQMWFSPEERAALELRSGDLLVSEGGDVGRAAMWLGSAIPHYFQNSINRVRSREGHLTRFLFYWLGMLKGSGYVDVLCNKATIAHFTAEKLEGVEVAFPSLEEQRSIVSFLDRETAKIDGLVEEQRRLIELLTEKREAIVSHAVTKGLNPAAPMKDSGVSWIGPIPAHWRVGAFARITERVVVGIAEAAVHAYANEGVPILRSTNIRPGRIVGELLFVQEAYAAERGTKTIRSGDLVTVRTGHAGVTAAVPPELDGCQCFTMLVSSLNRDQCPEFFCQWLNSGGPVHYFSIEAWGAAQPNISVPILRELPCPVPPAEEQRQIVAFLRRETARIEALVAEAKAAVALLMERRAALISAAVTGKIDVRESAAAPAELEPA